MEYEYKGTVYEFPDNMDDKKALELIRIDQGEIKQPSKQPKLKSIGSTRSFEPLPYEERVQQRADELALKSLASTERDPSAINRVLAPTRQFTGTMTAHLNEALPYRLPGMIEKAIPGKVKTVAETLAKATPGLNALYAAKVAKEKAIPAVAGKVAEKTEALPEKLKNVAGIGMDVAQMIPAAGGGAKVGGKTVDVGLGATSKALKKGGKSLLKSEMKIKDVTAKLASKNVDKGAKRIINNIEKYGLESPTGGFTGISSKAQNKITSFLDKAENAILKKAKEAPGSSIDVDNTFLKYMDDIEMGRVDQVFGEEVKASGLADGIYKALELRGLTGIQPIENIPKIKQTIKNYGGGLFKKGAYNIQKDPLKQQVGEIAYLRLTEDLESIVPEIRKYNQAAKDIITVKTAADEAVKRIGNKNKIGLQDWMILFGGPTAINSLGMSGAKIAAIPGAGLIAKKALGSGRGASGMMSLGRGAEKLRNLGGKKISLPSGKNIKSIVGNQKGEIGVGGSMSMSTDILPAIKDPQTGKVYVGNRLYGHKFVSAKGETEAIKNRLQKEYFKDNISAGNTSTVGFIDKKGNFISRQEAETMVTRPRSLAQQFYPVGVLGATGATAAAGLTAYEKMKRKK